MAVSCRTHAKIGEIHFRIFGSQMGNQLIKFTEFHAKLKRWTSYPSTALFIAQFLDSVQNQSYSSDLFGVGCDGDHDEI